jgi:hypothetical protein
MYNSIRSGEFVPNNKKLLNSGIIQINKSITNSLSMNTNHYAYEYHWYRESDVPDPILLEDFKLTNEMPELKVHKNTKRVCKFDENDNLVCEYNSITEARKCENLSEKTMNKYISERTLFNDHYFTIKN